MLIGRKTRARSSAGRLACAAALLLGLAGVAPPALAQEEEAAAGAASPQGDRILVALLPLVIHSLDDQSFFQEGLNAMLQARLGLDQRLAVLALDGDGYATADLETARTHARGAGAAYVVYGSFTHFGQGASVDVTAAAVEGDAFGPRQVFVHSRALGEIIPSLDGLTERVARFILEGPSQVAGAVEGGDAGEAATGDMADVLRRLEALERAIDPEVAAEEDVEVPSIFQVYPEDGGSATN